MKSTDYKKIISSHYTNAGRFNIIIANDNPQSRFRRQNNHPNICQTYEHANIIVRWIRRLLIYQCYFNIIRCPKETISGTLHIRPDVASAYASECNVDARTCVGTRGSWTAGLGHIRNACELVNYLCDCSGAGTSGKRRALWDHICLCGPPEFALLALKKPTRKRSESFLDGQVDPTAQPFSLHFHLWQAIRDETWERHYSLQAWHYFLFFFKLKTNKTSLFPTP